MQGKGEHFRGGGKRWHYFSQYRGTLAGTCSKKYTAKFRYQHIVSCSRVCGECSKASLMPLAKTKQKLWHFKVLLYIPSLRGGSLHNVAMIHVLVNSRHMKQQFQKGRQIYAQAKG